MKRFIILLITLVVAIILGLWIKQNPGAVYIVLPTLTIQAPLWFAIIAVVVLFIIMGSLLRLIKLPSQWRRWLRRRKQQKTQRQSYQGFLALLEGQWRKANKQLLRSSKHHAYPLLNYLALAFIAQQQGSQQQRDDYLQQAYRSAPQIELIVGLTQARLQLQQLQYEQALATSQSLIEKHPKHPALLALLKTIYITLQDWSALENLLPILQHKKLLVNDELTRLQEKIYHAALNATQDITVLNQTWKIVPKAVQQQLPITKLYIKKLMSLQQDEQVEHLIRHWLKKHWDNELIAWYGEINHTDSKNSLRVAQAWLKQYGQQAPLLHTLGQLCMHKQLWGQARDYFLAAIAEQANAKFYAGLARAYHELDEQEKAAACYRQGLLLAT
ncbi:MAG: hypothetical protein JKY13_02095 [Gammaproteobacteria bacterium]|nr:hypothetical protein [Gammaproteobacteria bacterium]